MQTTDREFKFYKGLQQPLIFKSFKGKYITWGAITVIAALILCVVFSSLLGFLQGCLALVSVIVIGFSITAWQQRQGLHRKTKSKGVFIVNTTFK